MRDFTRINLKLTFLIFKNRKNNFFFSDKRIWEGIQVVILWGKVAVLFTLKILKTSSSVCSPISEEAAGEGLIVCFDSEVLCLPTLQWMDWNAYMNKSRFILSWNTLIALWLFWGPGVCFDCQRPKLVTRLRTAIPKPSSCTSRFVCGTGDRKQSQLYVFIYLFVSSFISIHLHYSGSMSGTAKFLELAKQKLISKSIDLSWWCSECEQKNTSALSLVLMNCYKVCKTFWWPQELNKDHFPKAAYSDSSKLSYFSKINKKLAI